MTTLTEVAHTGGFILTEAGGHLSRENITVLSGEVLKAGHVLGRKSTAATVTGVAGTNTGNGTIGSLAFGKSRKNGRHRVVFTEPGTDVGAFYVEDPDGVVIGTGNAGTAYAGDGPAFTIADGSTDFAAGDTFTVTVTGATFKYREYNPANTDGTQTPVGILLSDVDATLGDVAGVAFVRNCEVNAKELVWFSGASTAQKVTGRELLAQEYVVAR